MADMRSIVESFNETFNRAEFHRAPEIMSDDIVVTAPGAPPMSRDEFVQFAKAFKDAAPDSEIVIDEYYEEGDRAIVEGRFVGTHTAPFSTPQGEIPAQGKKFELPYADFFTIREGKITSHSVYYDNMTFLASIGAMPSG